jgi:GAF domain-containing protein
MTRLSTDFCRFHQLITSIIYQKVFIIETGFFFASGIVKPSQSDPAIVRYIILLYLPYILSSIYVDAYDKALQMCENGHCKDEILGFLVSAAERASGSDSVAPIVLLDENGLLRNGSSPRLPADYLKAIDGIKPSPNLGTCAAAAATGLPVLTPSFYADNKWAELRHLATAIGFVGAWSMPIKNKQERVLGTFGTYFRKQREPSAEEMKGVELLASAAAVVVGRKTAAA